MANVRGSSEIDIRPAFAGDGVPVVFSSSAFYLRYLPMAMRSLLANSRRRRLDFIILVCSVSDAEKADFLRMIDLPEGASIRFVDIRTVVARRGVLGFRTDWNVPEQSLYRLLVAETLAEFEKVVYLDCDLICKADIADLFEQDLTGVCFAAAADAGIDLLREENPEYDRQASDRGFSDWGGYVNAGVMVMNLAEIRARGLVPALIDDVLSHRGFLGDQDSINFVCHDLIKVIDSKWNFQTAPLSRPESVFPNFLPWVCHYTGRKPWDDPRVPYSHLWWQFVQADEMGRYWPQPAPGADENGLRSELKAAREEVAAAWEDSAAAWKDSDLAWKRYNEVAAERDKVWEDVKKAWKAHDDVKSERDAVQRMLAEERAKNAMLLGRIERSFCSRLLRLSRRLRASAQRRGDGV